MGVAIQERGIVGGDHDCGAPRVRVGNDVHDVPGELGIEVPRRLVGQQERWVRDQRSGDRDPLLLTPGERARPVLQPVSQTQALERAPDAGPRLAPRSSHDLERDRHVLVDRAVLQELEVLEDHADLAAQTRDLGPADAADVAARDQDLSGCRALCTEE